MLKPERINVIKQRWLSLRTFCLPKNTLLPKKLIVIFSNIILGKTSDAVQIWQSQSENNVHQELERFRPKKIIISSNASEL